MQSITSLSRSLIHCLENFSTKCTPIVTQLNYRNCKSFHIIFQFISINKIINFILKSKFALIIN
jgi:hypothetical protein